MIEILSLSAAVLDRIKGATYSILKESDGEPALEFDAIDEARFTGSATATQYPSETGQRVTDYKYSNPSVVECVGIISKSGTVGIAGMSFDMRGRSKKDLILNAEASLDQLKDNMILCRIQMRGGALREHYTLIDYHIIETVDNFTLFEVEMRWQEVPPFATAKNENPADPADTGTISTGMAKVRKLLE
jgi:hypothetical protein